MAEGRTAVKRPDGDKDLTHDPRRLKYRRVAAGLSVTDLADKAGYSKAHISMLEDGQHGASPECLRELARALRCEIADLMAAEPSGAVA